MAESSTPRSASNTVLKSDRKEPAQGNAYLWLLLELVILLLGLVMTGGLLLSILLYVGPTSVVRLLNQQQSAWLVATVIALAGVLKLAHAGLWEVVRMTLLMLDHAFVRLLSVVVVGAIESSTEPTRSAKVVYWGSIFLLSTVAWAYWHYVLDGAAADFTGLQEDLKAGTWPLAVAWASIRFAVGTLLVVLPIRMMYSKSWQTLLERAPLSVETAVKIATTNPAQVDDMPSQHEMAIAHLSDLHSGGLVKRPGAPAVQIDQTDLTRLMRDVRGSGVDAIVISGDVTDSGTDEGWEGFLSATHSEGLAGRVVLAPGNHDLNAVYTGLVDTVFRFESLRLVATNLKALAYLRAADRLMGDRARLICPFTGAMSTLREVLGRVARDFEQWEQKRLEPHCLRPAEVLERLFPMVVAVHSTGCEAIGCQFVVWNSVKRNRWPVFNAVGRLGAEQLDRMKRLATQLEPGIPLIHIVHHQIGLPKASQRVAVQERQWMRSFLSSWMALEDPGPLVAWLANRRQPTLLLHGHHHKFFVVREDRSEALVVSAPSATMGVEESYVEGVDASYVGTWLEILVARRDEGIVVKQLNVRTAPTA